MAHTSGKALKSTAKKQTRARAAKPRVVALLPAHNEQDIIESTIDSLMNQSYPLEYVLVITDNCTDDTEKIVRRCQKKYGADRLKLTRTVKNKAKKARCPEPRLPQACVINLNSSSVWMPIPSCTKTSSKRASNSSSKNLKPAVLLGVPRIALKADATRWERVLWRLQNIEFGLANAWRVENYKSARVLPGVSVMFRTKARKTSVRSTRAPYGPLTAS